MSISTMLEHGATRHREKDSTHYVSEWRIPGGCDYSNAYLIYAFFNSREAADAYVKKYNTPPEIPSVVDLLASDIFLKKCDLDRFNDLRIRPNGCGMFFLKFFDKVMSKQTINPVIIEKFKKCNALSDLQFLINIFTIQE